TSSSVTEQPVAAESGVQPLAKPSTESRRVARASKPSSARSSSRSNARAEAVATTPVEDALARFGAAVEAKKFDEARVHADRVLHDNAGGATLLNELTYRLMDAGGTEQATTLLSQAYPFADRSAAERDLLVQRLALLASNGPANGS